MHGAKRSISQPKTRYPLLLTGEPPQPQTAASGPIFDFESVFGTIKRRIWLILSVVSVCIALTLLAVSMSPDRYRASVSLILEEAILEPFGEERLFAEASYSNPYVESQMLVIQSPLLISKVVDDLALHQLDAFMETPTTPVKRWVDGRLERVRSLFSLGNPPQFELSEEQLKRIAAKRLQENLGVSRAGLTLVLNISFISFDPELSARIANAAADAYIATRAEIRSQNAALAAEWFDERIVELRGQALASEASIAFFRSGGANAARSDVDPALQDALRNAISDRVAKQATYNRLTSALTSNRPLRLLSPRLLNERIQELAANVEKLNAERSTATDQEEIDTLIVALEWQIREELRLLAAESKGAFDAAVEREEEARAALETSRVTPSGISGTEFEVRNLEAESRIYRQFYENYFGSLVRMLQQQSFPFNDVSIIASAFAPEFPLGPSKTSILALAAAFGLTLAIVAAFLQEAMDDRLRSRGQLEQVLGASALGVLPLRALHKLSAPRRGHLPDGHVTEPPAPMLNWLNLPPERVLSSARVEKNILRFLDEPFSKQSEAIRRIKLELDRRARIVDDSRPTSIISFVSHEQGKACSLAALSLAEMLASTGYRTLLIDLNWIHAYLTQILTPEAERGIAECRHFSIQDLLGECAWMDSASGLYILPNRKAATPRGMTTSILNGDLQHQLLERLQAEFQYIILDATPLNDSIDSAVLSDLVFAYVMVVEWGVTSRRELSAALTRSGLPMPKVIGGVTAVSSAKEIRQFEKS